MAARSFHSHVRRSIGPLCTLAAVPALLFLWVAQAARAGTQEQPIQLHPENAHYFLWRGRPTVLMASTEHYGAVLNADFDYRRYLDELRARGLNYTRLFSGVYCEPWGEPFNTLNPPKDRPITPWARSATPGYADGGNKFDLGRWDEAYFSRLCDFLREAAKRGIIAEITLFCNWYDDKQWRLSPLLINNNVNNVGSLDFQVVNTLRNGEVLKHQEAMVRQIVTQINEFDNLFFEICNEPGAEGDWMDHMARLVYEVESSLPNRHLIANNGHATPHLSILNAHYDRDGSFVRNNYGRNLVIGYDETGFDGADDYSYRRQGWNFLLSGGGLYDNLDWSFSVAHSDGTETKWDKNLGGGSPTLRQQLGILLAFLNSLDFISMEPDKGVIAGGVPKSAVALAEQGRQYAIYLDGGQQASLSLTLPAGAWRAEWVNTRTGQIDKGEDFKHDGGPRTLASPAYSQDIALRLRNTEPDRTAPRLESVAAVADQAVRVCFSEKVTTDSAVTTRNYTINHDVSVTGAAPAADGRTVTLTTSPLTQGVSYRLAVRNITDRASPANPIAADSGMDFQYDGWSFYRAVNLGGAAVTIDGNRWDAGGAPGVSFAGSSFDDQSVALHPPTDAGRATMIRNSIWNNRGSNVTLKDLPAGTYKVYLYVWEDNVSQTFDISLNGSRVRQGYSSGAAGHWERLGPWRVDVTNGTIALQCSPGDANLSGIELWRLSSAQESESEKATAVPASQTSGVGSALGVSENGRYLVRPDGKPFFWLGDTAWLLSQMTTREDADLYLKTRAQQGFSVIQAAIVMGEERVGGTLRPNVYGDLAFSNNDPASPLVTPGNDPGQAQQYDYWDHVDYIIERAATHGLTLGLLPLFVGWGGDGYKYLTPERAYGYGLFLGQRYRDKPHVLWILGGDNTPDTEPKQRVWNEVARGITVGVAGTEDHHRTLMTYHINGGNSSSKWFHRAPWLDFNMIQVWGNEKEIYPEITKDYQLTPAKPTGLGEGSYEDGPQYPTRPIDALKIRKQACWSYLAGGYHTYGNTDTWNFSSYKAEGTRDWKTSLQSPGAAHLSLLAQLFAFLEWWKLVPDPTLFAEGMGSGETLNAAMRSTAGDRLLVYLSAPATFSLHLDALSAAKTARVVWIDPRTGTRSPGEEFPATGTRSFSTPKDWPDALLLVEVHSGSR